MMARSLADTASTDTDGSSIHTPASTPVGCHSLRPGPVDRLSTSSAYSPVDLATYVALSQQALRLREFLVQTDILQQNTIIEEAQLASALKALSRRRAWSSCALPGGAPADIAPVMAQLAPSTLRTHQHIQSLCARTTVYTRPHRHAQPCGLSVRTIEHDVDVYFLSLRKSQC